MGATLALLLLALDPAAPAALAWRLGTEPHDAEEAAVRDAAASADPTAAFDALGQRLAGKPAAGLARLGAGLRLLDAGKPREALAQLQNADVDKSLLRDHAFLARARALDALGRSEDAAVAALAAADEPGSDVACDALPLGADLFEKAGRKDDALAALERAARSCSDAAPEALLRVGNLRLARGERAAAAAAFDELDRRYPLESEAQAARARLVSLADAAPQRPAAERARQQLERAGAFLASSRTTEALAVLHAIPIASLGADEADLARLRLGNALLARGRRLEGRATLAKIEASSPYAAEAAFRLAADTARRASAAEPYLPVAERFRGTPWGEEALLALANHYQKDALDDSATPWWRRLLAEYPDGRYVERAAWRAGWSDFHAGRFREAAETFEQTARRRPPGVATAGLLYWAGRARLALGDNAAARDLWIETLRRYKHAYHGVRAREALAKLNVPVPPVAAALETPALPLEAPLPEPRASRARLLLLLDRLDEAAVALRLLPETPRVTATLAWVEWRRGRYRPAIVAMKRAYPDWVSEAGDRLPREVWQILYPIRYQDELVGAAREDGLDPALVAALILQESSFDAGALSRAGARGLMQVMPTTGRKIARAKGVRYKRAALNDPVTSLDFGTHYLRQMSERYSGAAEQVLAAYNAGPHRVDAWTALRGEQSPEEFIETIPFSETRAYVMIVLASREQYRRLYGLNRTPAPPALASPRP